MFGLRTVIPPILLPAPRPERHPCICTPEAGARAESCTWAGEHGNAQGVSTHGGGCAHAGVHVGKYAQGVGAHEGQCARFGSQSEPGSLPRAQHTCSHVMLNNFMLVMSFTCWSEQAHPTMSRMSSPLRSGKDITANVLCIYFSADANSFQDSIWMKTKGLSSL